MIKKNISIIYFLLAVISLLISSCDPAKKFEKEEAAFIQDYLNANTNLNFVKQSSGLYYLELVGGEGVKPVLNDSAFVKYTGSFLDGRIFDSNVSSGSLYGFVVGENIVGFDEGVLLMSEGGKASFLIPSYLGYGTYGRFPIQGYTPLLFDIELVRVVAGPF